MYYLKANIGRPLQFLSAGIFTAESAWIHEQRVIDSFEVIMVIQGSVYLQQDDEKYELNAGDFILIFPGHPHKGYTGSVKGTSFFWVHFNCNDDFIVLNEKDAREEISRLNNNRYFMGFDEKILLPLFYHPSMPERLSILFRQLLHVSQSGYYTGQVMNYFLTSFAIELTEQALSGRIGNGDQIHRNIKLSAIVEWIRIHCCSKISLNNVAHEFNYTKEYLARYFKKHMGMSMQEYINRMKISKAKELLVQLDVNIREVSRELGFTDDKYFLKLFKQYEKITPQEYRRAYHKLHMNNK